MAFRIGLGFDSHPFDAGGKKPLKLGGVVVDEGLSLKGHSDVDVLLHALTDALLGAVGAPDIGELFPPSSPEWRDADSSIFLKEALRIVGEAGYRIENVDCVVICDRPKIAPHKGRIIESLAKLLEVDEGRVNLKGKTCEGFCNGEGITVICTVLLSQILPSGEI